MQLFYFSIPAATGSPRQSCSQLLKGGQLWQFIPGLHPSLLVDSHVVVQSRSSESCYFRIGGSGFLQGQIQLATFRGAVAIHRACAHRATTTQRTESAHERTTRRRHDAAPYSTRQGASTPGMAASALLRRSPLTRPTNTTTNRIRGAASCEAISLEQCDAPASRARSIDIACVPPPDCDRAGLLQGGRGATGARKCAA